MALPPTNPPGLVRDAEDLSKVVNGDGTTNRAGESLPSIKSIIEKIESDGLSAAQSTGWFIVGEFSDGFEFTARNQVGRDADGNMWSYNASLPFTVTAGTTPSEPDYTNRGDAALRSGLAQSESDVLIAGLPAERLANTSKSLQPNSELYDIFVIYGQSNAKGSAGGTQGRVPITENALYWSLNSQGLEQLTYTIESTSTFGGSAAYTSTGHAWGSFANRYYQLTGRKIVFVPAAIGGASIAQLSKGNASGIYADMLSEFNKAKDAVESIGAINNVCALFNQGETDQQNGTSFDDYRGFLLTLIDNMTEDLSLNRFYVATVGNPQNRPEQSWHIIRSSQEFVCASRDNVIMAYGGFKSFTQNNNLLRTDGVHATQRGYNAMGEAMAEVAAVWSNYGNNAPSETPEETQNNYPYPEVVSSNKVKMVAATVRVDSNGATLLTRDEDPDFATSFVSSISIGSTGILFNLGGFRSQRIFACHAECYDENNQAETIDAHAIFNPSSTYSFIRVRLNQDTSFSVNTNNGGIFKRNGPGTSLTLFDSSSISVADGGSTWDVTHNNSGFNPVITPITAAAADIVITNLSATGFSLPKSIGSVGVFLPSFSIRPDALPAGGASLIVKVTAIVTSDAD